MGARRVQACTYLGGVWVIMTMETGVELKPLIKRSLKVCEEISDLLKPPTAIGIRRGKCFRIQAFIRVIRDRKFHLIGVDAVVRGTQLQVGVVPFEGHLVSGRGSLLAQVARQVNNLYRYGRSGSEISEKTGV